VEFDDPERERGVEQLRRFHTRTVLAALIFVVVAAAVAAGLAVTRTQSTPIGTGVVIIETNLAYQGQQAAGTGMVLTPSGEVLTNNHVIRGATAIRVKVPSTGQSYTAEVVGYDVSDDVSGRLNDCRRRPGRAGGRKRRWHGQAQLRLRHRDECRPRDHRERRPGRKREPERADRDKRGRAAGRLGWAAAEHGRPGDRDGYRRVRW
jgi:hypothetical protein